MIPLYIDFVNIILLDFSIYSVSTNVKHNLFLYFPVGFCAVDFYI